MQSERRRSKDLFKQFAQKSKMFEDIKLSEKIGVEEIPSDRDQQIPTIEGE